MAKKPNGPDETIDARPTKEFFIFMLTKDISLIRAIVDLVDNSWDGANRLKTQIPLKELSIRIDATAESFRISDNCGGISYEVARDYAFRFGRPKEMPLTHHSVGQFGVGMKRSLFKLGTSFRVESNSQDSSFVVKSNTQEWLGKEKWEFEFSDLKFHTPRKQLKDCGTNIIVSDLHEAVSAAFSSDIFISQLKEAIEESHQQNLNSGLAITLNKIPLTARISSLATSSQLKPAHETTEFYSDTESPVTVKLIAGVSSSDPGEAGWTVYCNGRAILNADTTPVTGWGEGNGRTIPRYHNQFARFRGFCFFDCDDASKLPWNTTKTGVDSDSVIYHSVRQRMVEMMRPVIDFLNRLDAEMDQEPDNRYLTSVVASTKSTPITSITASAARSQSFVSPKPPPPSQKPKGPKLRRIQYDKPEDEIEQVMSALGVSTLKDVGIETFDYYRRLEC